MTQRLVFPKAHAVKLESFSLPEPAANEVLIKNKYTLMSTGTENIAFNHLFEQGTHWAEWVKYPFYPGYAAIGEVTDTGSNVKNISKGDTVIHRGPHASHEIQNKDKVCLVPQGISHKEATWFALAKISFMGAKAADYFLGDSVMIVGAGPIGQTSVRWAKAAGCSNIIVVDLFKSRLELAVAGGASITYNEFLSEKLKYKIMEHLNGKLPDIVIDTSGNAKVFSECLHLTKDFGKMIILGDTGAPSEQHLCADVITRGLSIHGAHDIHSGGDWPDYRIFKLFFTLQQTGRYDLKDLNTHEFKPEDCLKAYQIANENRGDTMGIIFNWDNN